MAHKILVVEDDQDIRALLGLKLQAAGFEVVFARDAVSATTVARKEQPDAAILDLGLPGGDGFLVMERMRAMSTLESIPVVVMTARTGEEARRRAEELGARAFFDKPFDAAALIAKLREIVGA